MPGPMVRAESAAPTYRLFIVMVALCVCVTAAGCVRIPRHAMSGLWNRGGNWHWPVGADKSVEISEPPNVSANVARSSQSEERKAGQTTAEHRSAVSDETHPSPDTPSDDVQPAMSGGDPFDALAGMLREPPQQRIRELKEALSADAERELAEPPPPALHPMRLRVDGLLRRAQELLKGGELKEARRMAQVAAELSDSVSLEFLPTDERPNDLLREIDDQLGHPDDVLPEGDSQELPRSEVAAAPDADELSPPGGSGTVAANVPRAIQALHDEPTDLPSDTGSDDVEVLPTLTIISPEPLTSAGDHARIAQLARREAWSVPGGESAVSAPEPAPPPPTLGEIGPLPRFADRTVARVAPADSVPVTSSHGLFWTDWLAAGALAAIFAVVGLALGIRRWRCGI